jgi:ATP-dependent exoDNAse (exonuclease V) beta subunit
VDLRDEEDRHPAAHRLAALRDAEREEAEDRRLLYVAATRAREKLLISAHTKIGKGGGLQVAGWLKRLAPVSGLDEVALDGMPPEPQSQSLDPGIGCRIYPWQESAPRTASPPSPVAEPASQAARAPGPAPIPSRDLVPPLVVPAPPDIDGKQSAREAQPPRRVWRVVPRTQRPRAPAWVLGTLTHAALRHWRFDQGELEPLLRPLALELGVVDPARVHAAIVDTSRLLRRFRAHPLWAELDAAQRWHEVPFSVARATRGAGATAVFGAIDLLCRQGDRWRIVEFKTDRVRSADGARAADAVRAHIRDVGYDAQVRRYLDAVRQQLGVEAEAIWVMLNTSAGIAVVPAPLDPAPR